MITNLQSIRESDEKAGEIADCRFTIHELSSAT